MVELLVDKDSRWAEVWDDKKQVTKLTITRVPRGHSLFVIDNHAPELPKELRGRFSSLHKAIEVCTKFLEDRPVSPQVKRKYHKKRMEDNKNAADTATGS